MDLQVLCDELVMDAVALREALLNEPRRVPKAWREFRGALRRIMAEICRPPKVAVA